MESTLFFGAIAGAIFASLTFAARRKLWVVSRPFFVAVSTGGMVLAAIAAGFILLTGNKGGDSSMIAAMAIVFGLIGAVLTMLFSLLAAFSQSRALRLSLGAVWITLLFEPVAAAFIGYEYHSIVAGGAMRRMSEKSRDASQKQREEVARLEREIPERYRDMPPQMIAEHIRMRAQSQQLGGPELPRIVPEDVEAKIVAYHRAKAMPQPQFDFAAYNQANRAGWHFLWGTIGGWFLAALLVPMALKPKVAEATPDEPKPPIYGDPC